MPFKQLLNPEIQNFMAAHEKTDVKTLGLKKPPNPDWPYALILDQIKARQKAQTKLPHWQAHNNQIIFPPSDLLEQASSTATARYKASLVKGQSFIDLSAGCGVDSHAFTEYFKHGVCVEHNESAATLLSHNLPLLSKTPIDVRHEKAEGFIQNMANTDLVYIDPQRRNENQKGFYKLEDCTPNVIELIPKIKGQATVLMIKTSPMLDIHTAIKDLKYVNEVHIVEWNGECKEVLYILDFKEHKEPQLTAVNIDNNGKVKTALTFTNAQESENIAPLSMPLKYLYEPGPAFQKSGAFNTIATSFNVQKIHKHTHLYTSDTHHPDFPGRCFEILETLPVSHKAMTMKKANISVRNFPSDTTQIRKKLKLKDGGTSYLFACTLMNEKKMLLHCQKPT